MSQTGTRSPRAEALITRFLQGQGFQVLRTVGRDAPVHILCWGLHNLRLIRAVRVRHEEDIDGAIQECTTRWQEAKVVRLPGMFRETWVVCDGIATVADSHGLQSKRKVQL